jgi:hypothetical protein
MNMVCSWQIWVAGNVVLTHEIQMICKAVTTHPDREMGVLRNDFRNGT